MKQNLRKNARAPIRTGAAGLTALFLIVTSAAGAEIFPGATWATATPQAMGMDPALLDDARSYALLGGGSGMIVRSGRVVLAWGNAQTTWEMRSATKSMGSILLGMAIDDGLLDLDDVAQLHLPGLANPPTSNLATGWIGDIDVRSLATHAAGFPEPAGYEAFSHEPKTTWQYSNGGANWLADILTVRYGADLAQVFKSRVLDVIGVPSTQFSWRPNDYRDPLLNGIPRRELGSGVAASVNAMARIGYLCLRQGTWNSASIFPASYAAVMGQADPSLASLPWVNPGTYPDATSHYGLLWWTNSDGSLAAPTDTYFAWGSYESLIVVIPSLDIVAARAGGGWQDPFTGDYSILAPFIEPIAASVSPTSVSETALESWAGVKARFRGAQIVGQP